MPFAVNSSIVLLEVKWEQLFYSYQHKFSGRHIPLECEMHDAYLTSYFFVHNPSTTEVHDSTLEQRNGYTKLVIAK